MVIGIDASRAFQKQRTGIEEYSYQVLRHLREKLQDEKVFLYLRYGQKVDFQLPKNWRIRRIRFPYLWTQIGLSLEMLLRPVDVLFIPAHTVPIIHPKNTIVTIHGLEYEIMPEAYSWPARLYMRWTIRLSCRWAKKIICASRNTRDDLMRLYEVPEKKMQVIYEGAPSGNFKFEILNLKSNQNDKILNYKPYLLFVGRLEKRKNIEGIVEAFKILKEKYKIPHKLVLAGKPGFGYENLKLKISNSFQISNFKFQIIELGYVDEALKWQLIFNADVFMFPTFYEGFGLPILEAQSVGVPVVASNTSSMPEVAGDGAAYVTPTSADFIAEATHKLISDQVYRDGIIEKGHENVKRFSWETCAQSVVEVILS